MKQNDVIDRDPPQPRHGVPDLDLAGALFEFFMAEAGTPSPYGEVGTSMDWKPPMIHHQPVLSSKHI